MLLSSAQRALAEARTLDEVKNLRDKAVAVKAYAKKVQLPVRRLRRARSLGDSPTNRASFGSTPQIGIGNYWRVSHEFLLLGVRGQLTFQDKGVRSWIEHKRTEHSRHAQRNSVFTGR